MRITETSLLLVTTGLGRPKNGVASLAHAPVVYTDLRHSEEAGLSARPVRLDCRVEPGNDQ
jgi:hypothetical protein